VNKYKLKSIKIKRYKYFRILLKFENIYIEKGTQDIELINKFLVKFTSTIEEGELNKI
jgi:hypothetical protein